MKAGSKVVAIRTHSQGMFKKGEVYTCMDIRKCLCKCPELDINIGMVDNYNSIGFCPSCTTYFQKSKTYWFSASYFREIDELSDHTTESLIEELETELVNN